MENITIFCSFESYVKTEHKKSPHRINIQRFVKSDQEENPESSPRELDNY